MEHGLHYAATRTCNGSQQGSQTDARSQLPCWPGLTTVGLRSEASRLRLHTNQLTGYKPGGPSAALDGKASLPTLNAATNSYQNPVSSVLEQGVSAQTGLGCRRRPLHIHCIVEDMRFTRSPGTAVAGSVCGLSLELPVCTSTPSQKQRDP